MELAGECQISSQNMENTNNLTIRHLTSIKNNKENGFYEEIIRWTGNKVELHKQDTNKQGNFKSIVCLIPLPIWVKSQGIYRPKMPFHTSNFFLKHLQGSQTL